MLVEHVCLVVIQYEVMMPDIRTENIKVLPNFCKLILQVAVNVVLKVTVHGFI